MNIDDVDEKVQKFMIGKSGFFEIQEVEGKPTVVLQLYTSKSGRKTKAGTVAVEKLGFTKSVKGFYVFVRTAMNPIDLTMHKGFFKQEVEISIPKDKSYMFQYLIIESHKCHVRDFARTRGVVTGSIDIASIEQGLSPYVMKKLGKPQRISIGKMKQLARTKEFLGLFNASLRRELFVKFQK